MQETWNAIRDVHEQNSFGTIREEDRVLLTFNVTVRDVDNNGQRTGFFEWYDESNEWYASGGLWFENDELVDFDGVFSLAAEIIEKLHEWGFDVKDMARVCAPSL